MKCLALLLCLFPSAVQAGLVKVLVDMQVCDGTVFCQNQTSYGSGAVVGHFNNQSIVLSAAHIFEPHDKQGLPVRDSRGKVVRVRVNGFPAKVVGKWIDGRAVDFAILLVEQKFEHEIPLGKPPAKGDAVTIYGWDFADSKNAQVWTKLGTYRDVEHGKMAPLSFTCGIGVSGGPALDRHGNLSGILVHSSGVMVNWDFRETVRRNIPGAILPPPLAQRYERTVPDPKDVPPPPDELANAQKEAAALKAALARAKAKLAEKTDTAPPPEETSEEEKTEETPSKTKQVVGTVATGVSKTLDAADNLANNPWVIAGIMLLTGGAGAGGLKAAQVFGKARALRKKVIPLDSDQPSKEAPAQEVPEAKAETFPQRQLHTRDTTEAEQLVRLGRLEGRDPLLDSFMGITFEDVLKGDLEGRQEMTPELKLYARSLWDRVTSRVESAAPLSTGSEYSDDWRKK